MIVNYKKKVIQIKIVYFGCALSGKTTSLKFLFKKFNKKDKLTSIETTTGRTLFFDFGTFSIKGGEWNLKISLYSATGQDFYASTRPATLTGADGIIFVIDSQLKYIEDNIKSWKELEYYYYDNLSKIPIVINLNKQDLEDKIYKDEIFSILKIPKLENIEIIDTIAIKGIGIVESFKKILGFLFPSIIIR